MRLHNGLGSNIHRKAIINDLNISRIKSHDFDILMQNNATQRDPSKSRCKCFNKNHSPFHLLEKKKKLGRRRHDKYTI